MFTGLIQQVGRLARKDSADGGCRLVIEGRGWDSPLTEGESIAVNGVCLTATRIAGDAFTCDVLEETLARTNLGRQPIGGALNLERALRLSDGLGGHLVAGHVDGLGTLRERRPAGRDWVWRIGCDPTLLQGLIPKGSVACDGVSLTIAALATDAFTVHLIPHTLAHTALRNLAEGDTLNLETDLIGKYVRRYLETAASAAPLTWDRLRAAGFDTP